MARSTRRNTIAASPTPAPTTVDIAELSNIERLLVAQAVHELGAEAWPKVSKLLSKHPLIDRPKNFFSSQTCNAIYLDLLTDASLEFSNANAVPKAPVNLKLAQKHYAARVLELRELITAEETKYKTLVQEIDDIRAGKWDNQILGHETPAENGDKSTDSDEEAAEAAALPKPDQSEEEAVPEVQVNDADEEDEAAEARVADGAQEEDDAEKSATVEEDMDVDVDVEATETTVDGDSGKQPKKADAVAVDDVEVIEQPAQDKTPVEIDDAKPEDDTEDEPVEEEAELETNDSSSEVGSPRENTPLAELVRRDGKRKAGTPPAPSPRPQKRARSFSPASPGSSAASPFGEHSALPTPTPTRRRSMRPGASSPSASAFDSPAAQKRFQTVIGMLHAQIAQHRSGAVFHLPIREADAPGYRELVRRPTDLKSIKAKIRDGQIGNSREFQREVYLMFANALMYNRPHSDLHHMAEEMMLDSESLINDFRQTEGYHARGR